MEPGRVEGKDFVLTYCEAVGVLKRRKRGKAEFRAERKQKRDISFGEAWNHFAMASIW